MRMHPDDVRERDIAWIKGPDPKLPYLRKLNGAIYSIVTLGGQYFGPGGGDVRQSPEYEWARGDDDSFGWVAMARLDLLLSWPEPGESLDRWVKALEDALDGKPPAVSKPPGGDSEKCDKMCKACDKRPAWMQGFCRACAALVEYARRQRDVLHDLSCYGYIANAAVRKEIVGVEVTGRFNTCRDYAGDIVPDGFMALSQAERCVKQIEADIARQEALRATYKAAGPSNADKVKHVENYLRESERLARKQLVMEMTKQHEGPRRSGRSQLS